MRIVAGFSRLLFASLFFFWRVNLINSQHLYWTHDCGLSANFEWNNQPSGFVFLFFCNIINVSRMTCSYCDPMHWICLLFCLRVCACDWMYDQMCVCVNFFYISHTKNKFPLNHFLCNKSIMLLSELSTLAIIEEWTSALVGFTQRIKI